MRNDRITSVNNSGIVPALIEHTHVKTQYICHINSTSHTAFIGADYHHMIGINLKILHMLQKTLNKLIGWLNCFKTMQWNRILDTWIMRIKGDDVVNTHVYKLLQCDGTVQGFAGGTLMLSAFIKERHDNGDSSGLSTNSSNDTLQILIMIVR